MRSKALLSMILAFSVIAGGLFAVAVTDSNEVSADSASPASGGSYTFNAVVGVYWECTGITITNAGFNPMGNPPPGLVFTQIAQFQGFPTGKISCTPNSSGTYAFSIAHPQGSSYDITLNVENQPDFMFTNPPAIDMIAGQYIEYPAQTNLASTITKESGASWLSWNGSALVGTAPSAGTYSVVLRAESNEGPPQSATQSITINVYALIGFTSSPPSAGIQFTEFAYTPSATIDSTFSVSGLPAGAVYQEGVIRWVPIVTGDFTFEVTAVSKTGPSQTVTQVVSFTIYPKLSFSTIPTAEMIVQVVEGSTIQFISMSTDATSVLWDFGDGTTSTEYYPEHTYTSSGDYTVTLTAYNSVGESTTETSFSIGGSNDFELPIGLIVLGIIVLSLIWYYVRSKKTKNGGKGGKK